MLWGNPGSPPEPFRLARQVDGLDLLELDGAFGHEIVEVAIGGTSDFRAIEIDLEGAAMVFLRPGRGLPSGTSRCTRPRCNARADRPCRSDPTSSRFP